MASANKPLSITDLCDDLLCEVFDRLTVKQVLAIQTVNKDFYRSVKKWLETVDELDIGYKYDAFSLAKTFGKKTNESTNKSDCFMQKQAFPLLEKMLTVCIGIKMVKIDWQSSLTLTQLVQLLSRCQQLDSLTLGIGEPDIVDDDWTRLVQLIKHCDIHLKVYCCVTDKLQVKHLEQLFTTAKRIKSVCFDEDEQSKTFLKTLVLLDESVEVKLHLCYFSAPVNDEVCDIITRRVDTLTIDSIDYLELSMRRFERLSYLYIAKVDDDEDDEDFPTVEFPRLKSLTICEGQTKGSFISRFFAAACQLNQLEELELYGLRKKMIESEHLTEMLAKTANITKLKIQWNNFETSKVRAFEKLFQTLSESSPRLRTVRVKLEVNKLLIIDFFRITNSLVGFARRRPEIDLKLIDLKRTRNSIILID